MSDDGFIPDTQSDDGFIPDSGGPSNAGLHNLGQSISRGLNFINNPGGENAVPRGTNVMEPGGNALFERLGERTTNYLTKKGANPYVAAGAGTLLGMANPESWITPDVPNTTIMRPRPSAATAEGVAAATKHGIPLTRAEITGSKPAAMTEVGLRSTLTGSGPLQEFADAQSSAVQSAENAVRKQHGTLQPPSATGMEAKIGLQETLGAAKKTAEKLYKQIPDLPIESPNLQDHLNTSMLDADALGDPKVSKALEQARNLIERPSGATETTSPKLGSEYSVGPAIPSKKGPATFQELNKLRNDLGYMLKKETNWSPITGPQISPSGQKILAIKEALDKDINAFAETNIGKYTEFGSAFQRAKGFYGDYANLKKNKLVQKLGKVPESDVSKSIFGPGRVEDVRIAQTALGEDGFKAVQDQYFSDLLDKKNIGNELDSRNMNSDFLNEALRPEQRQALKEVDAFRKRASGAERLAGNNSRTAQTAGTLATGVALWNVLKSAFTNPVMAIAHATEILGIPYMGSKAYLASGKGITLPTRMASKSINPLLLGQGRREQR